MTTTQVRTTGAAEARPSPQRRPLRSRLSAGHLAMLVAGLVALVGTYTVLARAGGTVDVMLAATSLEPGEPVTAASFAVTEVLVDATVLATLLTPQRLDEIDGHVPVTPIAAGELVRLRDLQPPSAPQGQRAMSVPVAPDRAVAGAVTVGDRVDIIDVRDGAAVYLVSGAEVLDVPSPTSPAGIGGLQTFSVTIAVDEATALRVAEAIAAGGIQVIRSTGASPAAVTAPVEAPGEEQQEPPADDSAGG